MFIERVTIQNLRGLERVNLSLVKERERAAKAGLLTEPQGERPAGAGWTVFAGRNGTGKTTLLQAIGAALVGGGSNDALLIADRAGWIRHGQSSARVHIWLKAGPDDHDAEAKNSEPNRINFGVIWSRSGAQPAE